MSNLSRSADSCRQCRRVVTSCRAAERQDTRLDLRMNPTAGVSAAEWLEARRQDSPRVRFLSEAERCLEAASSEEIAWVLREYGDDFQDPQESVSSFSSPYAVRSARTTWKPKG